MATFVEDLQEHLGAKTPVIFVTTCEPERAQEEVKTACMQSEDVEVIYRWSCTDMLQREYTPLGGPTDKPPEVRDINGLMNHVMVQNALSGQQSSAYIVYSAEHFLGNFVFQQYLLDAVVKLPVKSRREAARVIFVVPEGTPLPRMHERQVATVPFTLPDRAALIRAVEIAVSARRELGRPIHGDTGPEAIRRIAEAGIGLSRTEFVNALTRSLRRTDEFDLRFIADEKKEIVRRSGLLEYVENRSDLNDIGGLEVLKAWLLQRQRSFSDEAAAYGLPAPKGVLLLGVPGAGKSAAVKAIAGTWRLPCLRLDVGRVFGGIVGESERNIRSVIRTAETVAPVILWVDEVEKGVNKSGSSGAGDSGTSSRVLGTLLTWLSDKTSPIFVAMTANDVSAVPPELLRKGRLDEIFFVDLPTLAGRREIVSIHIRKTGRNPGNFDVDRIARAADTFTGAEIEQCILSGMYAAFSDGIREYTTDDVVTAVKETTPHAKTMAEAVELQRRLYDGKARAASLPEPNTIVSARNTYD